jgi:hypothetical protein
MTNFIYGVAVVACGVFLGLVLWALAGMMFPLQSAPCFQLIDHSTCS